MASQKSEPTGDKQAARSASAIWVWLSFFIAWLAASVCIGIGVRTKFLSNQPHTGYSDLIWGSLCYGWFFALVVALVVNSFAKRQASPWIVVAAVCTGACVGAAFGYSFEPQEILLGVAGGLGGAVLLGVLADRTGRRLRILLFTPVPLFLAAIPSAQTQPAPKYPTIDPLTHKSYTETIERDDVKATFDMIAIPGGVFLMGSPATEKGRKEHEGPRHPVAIKPLWVGKCEVTWGEYDLFWEKKANEKPPLIESDKKADAITRPSKANHHDIDWGYGRGKNQPVIALHHHAAMEYCRWLSEKTGKLYRLPTEAEWEWACRAGTNTAYSFGDDPAKLGEHAWIESNSNDMPHPVGMKKPNAWGLYDMHGNVAEWCVDQFDAKFYGTLSLDKPTLLPVKLPDKRRFGHVVRGGSWIDGPEKCRSASRDFSIPDWQKKDPQIPQSIWWNNADWVGFRVVRAVEEYETLKGLKSKITKESPN